LAQTAPESMRIFLLIGQSNMAGRGAVEPQDKVPHPRIFALNEKLDWVPAVDPLHFDKPKVAGVGPGMGFARTVAEARPTAIIGLVPAAVGGTSLNEWAVGGKLYTDAVRRAKVALQRGHLAGILWHQGEGDSNAKSAATYSARFTVMISQLRKDLGAPDVPVIVGETGRFRPNGAAINAVLATIPQAVPRCAFVSSEGLTDRGDHLHFNSASQREFGRRYAAAWLKLENGP